LIKCRSSNDVAAVHFRSTGDKPVRDENADQPSRS
jgi:hypothetical protein